MVVDDHPMWREGVARDLAEAGIDVVATAANGTEAITRVPAARPRRAGARPPDPRAQRGRGDRGGGQAGPDRPGADPVGASGEQQDVLEAVKAGATGYLVKSASRAELLDAVRRVAAGRHRVHPRPGRAGAGGVPPALRRRPPPTPGRHATADRAGDRGAAAGGQGDVLQADRRAAVPLPPDRAEPRAEHPAQAAAAQPRRSWSATPSSRGSTTRADPDARARQPGVAAQRPKVETAASQGPLAVPVAV